MGRPDVHRSAAAPRPIDDQTSLPERNLDVLRAVAVLLVLVDHVIGAAGIHAAGAFNWNWALGRLGVLLFFVHTALVLMSSIERGGLGKGWTGRFYLRRAFRIYPLAIVVVVLVVALRLPPRVTWDGSDMAPVAPSAAAFVANLLLVQNLVGYPDVLGPLWSLPLEVQMYLLLPLCFLVARRSSRAFVALFVGALALAVATSRPPFAELPGMWRLSMFVFGPCFLAGVGAYHLLRRGVKSRVPALAWPFVLATIAGLYFAMQPDTERPWLGWLACALVGAAIPLVREMPASPLTRGAHEVAKYSYGIYLAHVPLLYLLTRAPVGVPVAVRWIGFFLFLLAVPVLLYATVEAPLIRVGGLLARRSERVPRPDVPDPHIAVP